MARPDFDGNTAMTIMPRSYSTWTAIISRRVILEIRRLPNPRAKSDPEASGKIHLGGLFDANTRVLRKIFADLSLAAE